MLEALAEVGVLERFAAVERDPFTVLAQAHQRIAVIGLVALLVEVQADERLADGVREPGADAGIDDGDPEEIAGDGESADREVARQAPQDAGEGNQRDHRRQQPDAQIERHVDEDAQVVRDALIRIVDAAVDELQPIVGAVLEPAHEEVLVQPGAPLDEQHLLQVEPVDAGDDPEHRQVGEAPELLEEFGLVLFLQRVVEILVPGIELHGQVHHPERQPDHGDGEEQAFVALLRDPVGLRQRPESR